MPFRLKTLIALAISLIALALTISISEIIGRDAISQLKAEIGRSLALLADEAQDKLDRAMFERLQALGTLASVGGFLERNSSPADQHAALEKFQAANRDYAWVGYAGKDGVLASSTGVRPAGLNVTEQDWFAQGTKTQFVGEANVTVSAGGQSGAPGQQSDSFVDIAVPVAADGAVTSGVLGATLSPAWAEEVKDTLIGGVRSAHHYEIIVLNEKRQVLLGPPSLIGKTLDLPSLVNVQAGIADFTSERWPDGHTYLTGYSKSDGYRSYGGLHWIVLAREEQRLAFAPAETLQRDIILWGTFFAAIGGLSAWFAAHRLSQPLLQLAADSEDLRLGKKTEITEARSYKEVRILSGSLRSLVAELTVQKKALADANSSLESQVQDRTRQLAAQNIDLVQAKTAAERATEAKSKFLAAASHDLRQPLHAMTLFARALSRRVSGDEAPALVSQLEEALRALKGMFDALLDVSRLDAKMIAPEIGLVSVGDVMDRVAIGVRAEAEQSGLHFRSRRADWLLETDAALFETILRNLVSNALKFTRHGGILLATRRRDGEHVIDVYDTGPGIAEDRYEIIFQEFARTNARASGINDGLGLGLSIARRYSELLGMNVQVCSRPGRGSRFTVVLPLLVTSDQKTAPALAHQSSEKIGGLRIMVLDDEPLIVSALCRELTDRGTTASGFQTAAEAERALLRGLIIDIAIVDYDLRGPETGIQFVDQMSMKLGKSMPTLVLSGGTDSETLAALANSGKAWLTKPADPDFIIAALSSILKSSKPAAGGQELSSPSPNSD